MSSEGEVHEVVKKSLSDFCFNTLQEAKDAAEKENAVNPRKKFVYRAIVGEQTVFIIGQSLGRARSHAARYFKMDVQLAESSPRVARPIEAQLEDVDDVERLEALIKQAKDKMKSLKNA